MSVVRKNETAKDALGIARIEFMYYRAGQSHWRVFMKDSTEITLALPNLATETTVIRAAAEKLGDRKVKYPE